MFPALKDCQNFWQIRFIDIKKKYPFRTFFTDKPKMYLEMYVFMQEHDIDVDISYDENESKEYNETTGSIEDIIIKTGGKQTFPCIELWLEMRDFI